MVSSTCVLIGSEGNQKTKCFTFKMLACILESGVDLVKRMPVGGDRENLWIIFDHMKCL